MEHLKKWLLALLVGVSTCWLTAADLSTAPASANASKSGGFAGAGGALGATDLPAQVASREGANAPMEYILMPKDVVLIRVYDEADLETRAIISSDGRVTVPLMGEVALGGKTVEQAVKQIREGLGKDYLVNPQVTLSVLESVQQTGAQQGFTVLGQVNRPGLYPIPLNKPIDLLNAIALAGGYNQRAKASNVTVSRKVDGVKKTFKLDAEAMAKDPNTKPFIVQADDLIYVGEKIL